MISSCKSEHHLENVQPVAGTTMTDKREIIIKIYDYILVDISVNFEQTRHLLSNLLFGIFSCYITEKKTVKCESRLRGSKGHCLRRIL